MAQITGLIGPAAASGDLFGTYVGIVKPGQVSGGN